MTDVETLERIAASTDRETRLWCQLSPHLAPLEVLKGLQNRGLVHFALTHDGNFTAQLTSAGVRALTFKGRPRDE